MGYVMSNLTKRIAPNFSYPHELQKSRDVDILQTKSCENLVDSFTRSLPTSSFHRRVCVIDKRQLKELQGSGEKCPETIVHICDPEDHCGGYTPRYHKMVHGPHHPRWPGP